MIQFLKKLLKWRISFKQNVVYLRGEKHFFWHKCEQCRKGYWDITTHKSKRYIYTFTDDNFPIEFEQPVKGEDFDIYGWVIQARWTYNDGVTKSSWIDALNHKVYGNKEIAMDALNQFNKSGYRSPNEYEFRIRPVYSLDQATVRNILITELLKKEI
jgi:hypothetical protein